jgi:hypothetical protein
LFIYDRNVDKIGKVYLKEVVFNVTKKSTSFGFAQVHRIYTETNVWSRWQSIPTRLLRD